MKKSITALTVMSLTLQANDNVEHQIHEANDKNNNVSDAVILSKQVSLANNFDKSDMLTQSDVKSYKNANTDTKIIGVSGISFLKSVSLSNDADGSGGVTQGDTLTYDLFFTNAKSIGASGSFLSDDIDSDTSLVAGSVVTNGVVVSGNDAGDTNVSVDFDTIQSGTSVSVNFDVIVNDNIPDGQQVAISNQARMSTSNIGSFVSDDARFPGNEDPTLIHASGDPKVIPTNDKVGLWAMILALLSSVALYFKKNKRNEEH